MADVWSAQPPLLTLKDGAHAADVTHAAVLTQRSCCQINLIPRVAAKPRSLHHLLLLFYSSEFEFVQRRLVCCSSFQP